MAVFPGLTTRHRHVSLELCRTFTNWLLVTNETQHVVATLACCCAYLACCFTWTKMSLCQHELLHKYFIINSGNLKISLQEISISRVQFYYIELNSPTTPPSTKDYSTK